MLTRRTFVGVCALATCSIALSGCSSLSGGGASKRTIEDMGGRTVSLSEDISRVFCSNPIGTVDLYGLAPDDLVGWNFLPAGDSRKYIPEKYLELPSLGVWMGSGSVPNAEEIAAQAPDVIFCYWTIDDAGRSMADDIVEETGLPVVLVDYDLRSTPEMFRYVADLIGCVERGEELASYCELQIERIERIVASIPQEERKRVFLAQGSDGLTTDPVGSMHVTDAFELLGTENVADLPGTEGQGMGMPTVSVEQIISWNPDVVLVSEYSMSDSESSDVYSQIRQDRQWANVPCVAAGEIYRIPQSPFSWFGRPPSAVRLLGCLWLLKVLYPDYSSDVNIREDMLAFYEMFYRYDEFDEETIAALLEPSGIDPVTGEKLTP